MPWTSQILFVAVHNTLDTRIVSFVRFLWGHGQFTSKIWWHLPLRKLQKPFSFLKKNMVNFLGFFEKQKIEKVFFPLWAAI